MTTKADQGVISALLLHFNGHLYPRAVELEKRLDAGERLTTIDLDHLLGVFGNLQGLFPLVERCPEYREIAAGVFSLYAGIARRAWQNETCGNRAPNNN